MIEELRGTVRRCIYASDDGRFCVFQIEDKESRKLACATYHGRGPYVGEQILMRGCWQKHPRFGVQFSAKSMEMVKPEETEDIIHFLASGMIDGIRETMARRIVAHFGKKTMDVFENNIDALLEVPGIGPKGFEKIKKSYEMISGLKEIIMYLQSLAIPEKYAADMQKRYGENIKSVFQHEPYRMLKDIAGMTFLEVDRIAMDQGIAVNDSERITAGVTYMLGLALSQGHSCVPIDSLAKNTVPLLHLSIEIIKEGIESAIGEGLLPSLTYEKTVYVYLNFLYKAETQSADILKGMLCHQKSLGTAALAIEKFERENHITLAEEQKEAVEEAMKSRVLVITGGPGTGKTTLVRAIITAAEQHDLKVHLMAPTGRAAKRLALASHMDADTIHKALEAEKREDGGTVFSRDESDPLEEDLIIVDEASMMDISLFYHLLSALKEDARLILVGDVDQLPPVGPGTPLKSIIAWEKVPVTRLKHIFRQKEGSGIIENAALIREGNMCIPDEGGEFKILPVWSEEEAFDTVISLCRSLHYGESKEKMALQVLSPMYRDRCGVDNLNHAIQELVHQKQIPPGNHFFVGDKVMQKRNDYDKGVYNGDVGIVWSVTDKRIAVSFYDREVVYEKEERNDLQLAYATTVHKSQGSEYDTVILVLLPTQRMMLKRNLLYTGITRAKKTTYLITAEEALAKAVDTVETGRRYSLFFPLLMGETEG